MGVAVIAGRFLRFGPDLGAQQHGMFPDPSNPFTGIRTLVSSIPNLQTFIPNFMNSVVIMLITAAVLWILLRLILQYRELYADIRTIQFLGDPEPLRKALVRFQALSSRRYRRGGFVSLPTRILPGYHPPAAVREQFVREPEKILSAWFASPFIIGIIAAAIQLDFPQWGQSHGITMTPFEPVIPVFYPVTILIAILLLPKSTAALLATPPFRLSRSHPLVVVVMVTGGITAGVFLKTNLWMILSMLLEQALYAGGPSVVTVSYSYTFLGASWPVFVPVIGLVVGGFQGAGILAVLLLSGIVTRALLQCPSLKLLSAHPVLTLLVIPGSFAIAVTLTALIGLFLLAAILLLGGAAILAALVRKYRFCPGCGKPVTQVFHPALHCPSCTRDLAGWMKNPK
jgi:hypothetical protein